VAGRGVDGLHGGAIVAEWEGGSKERATRGVRVCYVYRGRANARVQFLLMGGRIMPYVLIRHKVADYLKWKRVFDAHGATRKAGGSKGGRLFRSADKPKEILILLRWGNLRRARRFIKSADLRKAMKRAGVKDRPDVYFLQERARPTA